MELEYTWGRGWGSSGDWEVLREIPVPPDSKPKPAIVLDGLKNEWIARAISVLLNEDKRGS